MCLDRLGELEAQYLFQLVQIFAGQRILYVVLTRPSDDSRAITTDTTALKLDRNLGTEYVAFKQLWNIEGPDVESCGDTKNAADFYATIFAPNAKVNADKGGDLFGSVIAKEVEVKDGSDYHVDASLSLNQVFSKPFLVR